MRETYTQPYPHAHPIIEGNALPMVPTSPKPAYTRTPSYRDSPPLDQEQDISQTDGALLDRSQRRSSSYGQPRKPVPIPMVDPSEGAYMQGASAAVFVHSPNNWTPYEASSVPIEDHGSQISASHSRTTSIEPSSHAFTPLPQIQRTGPSVRQVHRPVSHYDNSAPQNFSHARSKSESEQLHQNRHNQENQCPHPAGDPSSTVETEEEESYQPLQYHHQTFAKGPVKPVDKRASKLTMRSSLSNDSSGSEFRGEHLAPQIRQSARRTVRPDSGFSSTSELAERGRVRSMQLSPAGGARAVSTHSSGASPETRPLSYVDLLNVPYPQPPPVASDNLDHSKLRAAVGTNASLLSTRQTIEMYRANVKKTNDSAIQYEFAVFMISAAQDANLEMENMSISGISDRSSMSTSGDLLKEARQILQRLSDRSYPFAQYYLADGYASGLFNKGKEDNEKAFPLFIAAAKHGHAEASYRAALCYEFGWGCRPDAQKAVQFYRQAASKNHPGAMLRLGRACLMGDMGLGNKYREGVKWLKRGAESADFQYNSAPYELGVLHETGYGDDIFRDEAYAAQLFTKSADLGHPEACFRLGDAYEHGKLGCPRDAALSVHFYTGGAQRDHPLAQMALCAWYMIGAEPVLEKDENEAYEWARKAAESGLAKAQYAVGYFSEMGIGCRRDILDANVWYVKAAQAGDERASHRLAAIRAAGSGANPETIASGRGKASKLKQSIEAGNVAPGEWKIPVSAVRLLTRRPEAEKKSKKFGIF